MTRIKELEEELLQKTEAESTILFEAEESSIKLKDENESLRKELTEVKQQKQNLEQQLTEALGKIILTDTKLTQTKCSVLYRSNKTTARRIKSSQRKPEQVRTEV